MLRDQVQVFQKSLHGRVETITFFQLKRQAFSEVAGHNSRWIKALANV